LGGAKTALFGLAAGGGSRAAIKLAAKIDRQAFFEPSLVPEKVKSGQKYGDIRKSNVFREYSLIK